MMKALLFLSLALFTQDWTPFQRPTGQGVSDLQELPVTWSETGNCLCRALRIRSIGIAFVIFFFTHQNLFYHKNGGRLLLALALPFTEKLKGIFTMHTSRTCRFSASTHHR
jgi:hypothetical protein